MVLVLDLYDLVKQVRKMAKIGYKINMKDTTWQHPCDQPFKQYQVIDHSRGISKQMQFNMNACLLKTNITCQQSNSQAEAAAEEEEKAKAEAAASAGEDQLYG